MHDLLGRKELLEVSLTYQAASGDPAAVEQKPQPLGHIRGARKHGARRGDGIHSDLIPGTFRPKANRDNDYLIDRELQRTATFTGIKGIGTQDCAVQESMGTIHRLMRECKLNLIRDATLHFARIAVAFRTRTTSFSIA